MRSRFLFSVSIGPRTDSRPAIRCYARHTGESKLARLTGCRDDAEQRLAEWNAYREWTFAHEGLGRPLDEALKLSPLIGGASTAIEVYQNIKENGVTAATLATIAVTAVTARIPGGAKASIWSSGRELGSAANALKHWKNHGAEFPWLNNAKEYVEESARFLRSPPPGTLTKVRANGDVVRYDPTTNTFGVLDKDGSPRTMFKPDPAKHGYPSNMEYFDAQQ